MKITKSNRLGMWRSFAAVQLSIPDDYIVERAFGFYFMTIYFCGLISESWRKMELFGKEGVLFLQIYRLPSIKS